VPTQAQGAAHHDGKLLIDRGTVMRLTRLPAQVAAQPSGVLDFSDATLARVVPGRTTKAQVRALLGEPWRDMLHGDEENPANDVWDYRGQNASGSYLVHIEFDPHNVVTLVAKIPHQAGFGVATVAKDPPRAPGKP
jgi:hypothetical protein